MKKLLALLIFASIPLAAQVSNPSVRDSATDPTGVACTSAAPILRYTAAGTSTMYACTGTGGTTYAALAGSGGTPTALSPNPTIEGQTWGYFPGAAPNQGWSNRWNRWVNPADYGAVCDGVTDATPGFNAALSAFDGDGGNINFVFPSGTGPCVITSTLDLSGVSIALSSFDTTWTGTIKYMGVDAGPALKTAASMIGFFDLIRGQDVANQTMVEVQGGSLIDQLEVDNNFTGTDNNFISAHFKTGGGTGVKNIITSSPISIDQNSSVEIGGGTINNLNGLSIVSSDPIQFLGSFIGRLSLTNTWLWDSNTDAAACFIKLPNNAVEGLQINLHNVFMHTVAGFIGNAICGPTSVTGTDSVNGDFTVNDAHTIHSPTFAVNGQVQGTVVYKQDGVATSVEIVNGIAQSGFFYSAAGIPIPTPWFSTAPATSFVSDQTTSCSGTYTSGGAVKCKVWWNGTNWIAY